MTVTVGVNEMRHVTGDMQHMTHGNFVGTSWRVFCNAATIRTHQEIVTLVCVFFLKFCGACTSKKG